MSPEDFLVSGCKGLLSYDYVIATSKKMIEPLNNHYVVDPTHDFANAIESLVARMADY